MKMIEHIKNELEISENEKPYCIIFFSVHKGERKVRFVFKSFEDFEKRFDECEKSVDEMYGIDVQIWHFD